MRPSRRSSPIFARSWSSGQHSITALLIALQAGAFASQWLVGVIGTDRMSEANWLEHWLALDSSGLAAGYWWQFVSFGLLHVSVFHLLANVLLLFFAGHEVEPIIGSRHVAVLFFGGNLLGGFAHWLAMPEFALVGTSAAMAAVVAAYSTVLAEIEVVGKLFFVIPIRIKAKFFGVVLLLLGGIGWATVTDPSLGPVGVVVGSVFGWIYARRIGFGSPFWWQRRKFERRQRELRVARMTADQFLQEEIDPILEKISRDGMESLTRAERQTLEQGSEKIATRPGHR